MIQPTQSCANCTNDLPEKDMIWDNGIWLCKQCNMDLNLS